MTIFSEGDFFEDLALKSSISLLKINSLKCKIAKFSACGGLETLKTPLDNTRRARVAPRQSRIIANPCETSEF